MKKNKKGFTLVELIAAIIVLGIILTMATTAVVSQLNKNKRKVALMSAKNYVTAINDYNYIVFDNQCETCETQIVGGSVDEINPVIKKSITGDLPDRGHVYMSKGLDDNDLLLSVGEATLYINGYKVTYNGNTSKYTITAE
jgi:prepilin-type N-terminal cleavage/methylation domain-containing protein